MSKTLLALNRGESAGDSKQLAAEIKGARDARARAWRYVFGCYHTKTRAERASGADRTSESGDIDRELSRGLTASIPPVTPTSDRR